MDTFLLFWHSVFAIQQHSIIIHHQLNHKQIYCNIRLKRTEKFIKSKLQVFITKVIVTQKIKSNLTNTAFNGNEQVALQIAGAIHEHGFTAA